jgi:hypothetical protein
LRASIASTAPRNSVGSFLSRPPIPPPSSVTKKSRQVPPAVGTNVCGSNILATVTQDNKCYFSPSHVCEALGIDWKTQHRKTMADQVLTATMVEMTTVARDGKSRTMSMLPIEFLSGWLFT